MGRGNLLATIALLHSLSGVAIDDKVGIIITKSFDDANLVISDDKMGIMMILCFCGQISMG